MGMDLFMKLPMKGLQRHQQFYDRRHGSRQRRVSTFFAVISTPPSQLPSRWAFCWAPTVGTRVMQRLHSKVLRLIFVPVLAIVSIQMIVQGGVPLMKKGY